MKKRTVLCFAVALGLSSSPAMADSFGTISPKLSTLGVGLEYKYPVTDEIAVSAGFYGFNKSRSESRSDLDYNAKLQLRHFSVLGNYYPWDNGFHFAGGLVLNNSKITADAKPKAGRTYDFNGVTYTTADVGSADAEVSFRKIAPYVGIGWDNGNKTGAGLSVAASLGVMFTGSPKVDFNYTEGAGMVALKNTNSVAYNALKTRLDRDIAAERKELEDDVDSFKAYPVLSIGISYSF